MEHKLIKLPFEKNALEPLISEETIEYHYGKHHNKYVNTLNSLIKDTEFEDKPLVDIIKGSQGGIFNNAAQVFNHNFYWFGLSPEKNLPSLELGELIDKSFGSMESFKKEFLSSAAKLFGSGWTWLIYDKGVLKIENTGNADTPLRYGRIPLLACDVWEHAYYIDYRNLRPEYLEKWWELINWNFVSKNLAEVVVDKESYIQLCNYESDICDYLDSFNEGERTTT